MRIKGLLFCFAAMGIAIFIKWLPLGQWLPALVLPENKWINDLIKCFLIGAICWLGAARTGSLETGGFTKHRPANYWLLLLPFMLPGLYFLRIAEPACNLLTSAYLFFIFSRIANGVFEEVLFRGLILGYLQKKNPDLSVYWLTITNAFLFALIHLINLRHSAVADVISQLVYAFYMGLLFSALLLRTKNVWLLGLAHGLLNLLTSRFCRKEILYTEETAGWMDFISPLLIFSPVLLVYWLLLRNYRRPEPPALS